MQSIIYFVSVVMDIWIYCIYIYTYIILNGIKKKLIAKQFF